MTMRTLLKTLAVTLCLALAPSALADETTSRGNIDLGVAIGSPTGLELGWAQERPVAFNVGLGVDSLYGHASAYFDAEFRLLSYHAGRKGRVHGRVYIGPSAELGFGHYHSNHPFKDHDHDHDGVDLALTAPFGTALRFPRPVRLFAELRPGVSLIEHPGDFHIGGQLGVRFIF